MWIGSLCSGSSLLCAIGFPSEAFAQQVPWDPAAAAESMAGTFPGLLALAAAAVQGSRLGDLLTFAFAVVGTQVVVGLFLAWVWNRKVRSGES